MPDLHLTPIPNGVWERLPNCLANHPGLAFDVRVQAFPGYSGEQMFAIDVYHEAVAAKPADKRNGEDVCALRTTYYFDAHGGFSGEPSTMTTRWRG